jgi:hypothetical protein
MQRLYKRRLSICSLYDDDYSTSGILSTVGSESEKLDVQTRVDLELPKLLLKRRSISMDGQTVTAVCLSCDRSESEIPLLQLRLQGEQLSICSQCLPVLIHEPEKLVGRMSGAEDIEPSPHDHG